MCVAHFGRFTSIIAGRPRIVAFRTTYRFRESAVLAHEIVFEIATREVWIRGQKDTTLLQRISAHHSAVEEEPKESDLWRFRLGKLYGSQEAIESEQSRLTLGNMAKLTETGTSHSTSQEMQQCRPQPHAGAISEWDVHARLLLLAHDIHPNPGPRTHTPTYIYLLPYFVILTADVSNVIKEPHSATYTRSTEHTEGAQGNEKPIRASTQMAHQPGLKTIPLTVLNVPPVLTHTPTRRPACTSQNTPYLLTNKRQTHPHNTTTLGLPGTIDTIKQRHTHQPGPSSTTN